MQTTIRAILCSLLLLPAVATAGTVYTWTDADGVTHFSETPPADASLDTRQIEIDTPPAVESPVDADHFSVINQAERMQQSRLENERARTERLQAEAEARKAAAEARAANRSYDDDDYGNRYYAPLWGPALWPGHRPGRPGHLPSRPGSSPSRPTVGVPGRR
jgi:hypothetical protein